MKFTVHKAHNRKYEEIIEIKTLKDLINFKEECGNDIIIQDYANILIYDDYIE